MKRETAELSQSALWKEKFTRMPPNLKEMVFPRCMFALSQRIWMVGQPAVSLPAQTTILVVKIATASLWDSIFLNIRAHPCYKIPHS